MMHFQLNIINGPVQYLANSGVTLGSSICLDLLLMHWSSFPSSKISVVQDSVQPAALTHAQICSLKAGEGKGLPLIPLLEHRTVKRNYYQLTFSVLPEAEVVNNSSNPVINYKR